MTDLTVTYWILGIGVGFLLFLIGAAIIRAIFSIGKIVRLLGEIADSRELLIEIRDRLPESEESKKNMAS